MLRMKGRYGREGWKPSGWMRLATFRILARGGSANWTETSEFAMSNGELSSTTRAMAGMVIHERRGDVAAGMPSADRSFSPRPSFPPPPPSIGGSPHRTLSLSFLTSIDGSADLSFSPPFSMAEGWSRRKGETWWLGPGGIEALDGVWSDWVCDL